MIRKFIVFALLISMVSCGSGGGSSDGDSGSGSSELREPEIGLAIFALNNPRFPVDDAIDLLKATKPGYRASFAFTHRTFGSDMTNYQKVITAIADQRPHVQIYAICGPCRKPRADGSIEYFRPGQTIEQVNNTFKNPSVQAEYRAVLVDILNNYVLPSPELTFSIVPELESNFTREAESIALNIALEVFANEPNVKIIINRLDNSVLAGVPSEGHTTRLSNTYHLRAGDVLNFDGSNFLYPGESPLSYPGVTTTSFEGVQTLITDNIRRGIHVYLWRPEWQGRDGGGVKHPNDRNYTFGGRSVEIKQLLNLQNPALVNENSETPTEQTPEVLFLEHKDGFLWKPVSESNSNLVVLLPAQYTGSIEKRMELHRTFPTTETSLLESGFFAYDNKNGNRSHFRFNSTGKKYGQNVYVVVKLLSGTTLVWTIPNGGNRYGG